MKAIITVLGKDQVGIIAGVSSLLAKWNVNVLDISQTILQENFTMVMLVDTAACTASIAKRRQGNVSRSGRAKVNSPQEKGSNRCAGDVRRSGCVIAY